LDEGHDEALQATILAAAQGPDLPGTARNCRRARGRHKGVPPGQTSLDAWSSARDHIEMTVRRTAPTMMVSEKVITSPRPGRILVVMTSSAAKRRHLSSSPFQRETEPVIQQFALDDRVAHDTYGVGRVIGKDPGAVTVDFGMRTVHIVSPFHKLEKL